MASHAPVAYFAFNRPSHTARTLAALALNPEAVDTDLHIFIDGARNPDEKLLTDEVERVAKSARGFRTIEVVSARTNRGLYAAITEGVDRVVSLAGRVIVVEDDILVSPCFLAYMNDGLNLYASEDRVGSIHAYAPPIAGLPDYFFLRGGDCWGWATWENRWALFNPRISQSLSGIAGNPARFAGSHGWQSVIQLVRRAQKRNQSWAILWHASLFLAGRFTLHPGRSFITNIGNDGSGVHSRGSETYHSDLRIDYRSLPLQDIRQDEGAARSLSTFLDDVAIGRFAGHPGRLAMSLYARCLLRMRS